MKKIVPVDAYLIPKEAKRVFEGVIYDVYQWQQKMFDGTSETFEMLRRPDTVGVIAVRYNKVVVLRQLQPHWSKPKLGVPMGRVDEGEDPLAAAKRELQEETGLEFKKWKLLFVSQRTAKIEWFIYAYLATDLERQGGTNHESGEKIEIEELQFEEVKQLSKNEPRLAPDVFKNFNSLQQLLEAPEFKGKEIEIE